MTAIEIGAKIKKLREQKGQSKAYVARQLGISYNSVCSYEYGLRIPSDRVKRKIADYFGKTVEELFFAS